jgi:hypothetical protein
VARPQGVSVAPSSPSRTWSPEPQVVGEALEDDARTTTPPRGVAEGVATSLPVTDTRAGSPLRTREGVKTSAGEVGATTSPKILDVDPIRLFLVGLRTWSETSLRSTWRREVQKHPAHKYLHLQLQAQGCHVDQLIGITPLVKRIGSKTMMTCKPCGPASSPSITHSR